MSTSEHSRVYQQVLVLVLVSYVNMVNKSTHSKVYQQVLVRVSIIFASQGFSVYFAPHKPLASIENRKPLASEDESL